MCLEALREGLSCFSERLGVWQETIVFNKAAPEHLDVKFRSKFNHACLHCAIIKLYTFLRKKELTRPGICNFSFKIVKIRFSIF